MRIKAALLAFTLLAAMLLPCTAEETLLPQARRERALLIGIDYFVSQPSVFPSSTNNVYAMQEMFQHSLKPLEVLMIPESPVATPEMLQALIDETFGAAQAGDVNYLYISTHGVYDPEEDVAPGLLLSDGVMESVLSPEMLEGAFEGIEGTNVLILDACNSGAFIGKGMETPPEKVAFQGKDFKVLTSSGAMEQSWYWNSESGSSAGQGTFYFTQALCDSMSPETGYPADQNRDGSITFRELYDYLTLNHAASTPQIYPQRDDFVFFRYDTADNANTGAMRSPIMDVTFSNTLLDQNNNRLNIEFIAVRPVRVAYQLVYQRDGRWEFENAQLIYDEAERLPAFGNQAGAVSAGWKQRTLWLDELSEDDFGYALIQLVSIDRDKVRVHAGRVVCVAPGMEGRSLTVTAEERFSPEKGQELDIFLGHDYPCALSVAVVDESDKVVYRICHRTGSRPMGLAGTALYWDGRLKDGTPAPAGTYRIRAQAVLSDGTLTEYSEPFALE